MAISRFALSTPSANTDTLLYTANRNALVSVIITNKTNTPTTVRVWVQPNGATTDAQNAYISYDVVVPASNALETFRFPVLSFDKVYIRASVANISFSLNGIYESNGTSNITTGTTPPSSPVIGDVFVNTSTMAVLYWNGSAWVNGTVDTTYYPFSIYSASAPASPVIGQIWVNSTTSVAYVYTGSSWLALSDPNVVTLAGVQTVTNKTMDGGSNTFTNIPQSAVSGLATTISNLSTTYSPLNFTINAQTTNYTMVLSDSAKMIEMNSASANTLTIPPNSSAAFPIGASMVILQTGAGQTTLTAGAGVTLNATPGLKLRAQWSAATLVKRGTDTWFAMGDLTA